MALTPCVPQVAAGAKHTLALTAKGEVYSWGHGDNGRLGHGGSRVRAPRALARTRFRNARVLRCRGVWCPR